MRVEVAPQDRVLRGVIAEQRPAGDPRGMCDVVDTHRVEPAGAEQVDRDIGDMAARRGTSPAHPGRVHRHLLPVVRDFRPGLPFRHSMPYCVPHGPDVSSLTRRKAVIMEHDQQVSTDTDSLACPGVAGRRGVDRRYVRGLLTVTSAPAVTREQPPDSGVEFDADRGWRLHPQVAVRPEPFGALLYHFGTRKLSFLKNRTILALIESLGDHDDVRSACRAAGIDDDAQGPYLSALATLAPRTCLSPGHPSGAPVTSMLNRCARTPARRPVRTRAGRADLPDLGADLRLQPGVRALPVLVGQARSA